ncbi:MAG: acyl-CoA dehydrogenase family protein [Bauldia sp.]|uniref:acyl-CoA dehydrogenase family protein n=1 Tax=Bauldia sp. TaxID=2575872 RepID=UPI001D3B3B61|nr:acyl-CoA dehydrogenase family protein [Bauldia sp.]MCB1495975.1 acyl-CoA dehydrogenase family protein [Bauldia sp.]
MNSAVGTHDVVNQAPPLLGVNLFTSDPALSALVEGMPNSILDELAAHGQTWGTPETFELGRIANANPPLLKAFDPNGVRIDSVEFHPAYHALMRRSIAAGMHASIWDATNAESSVRSLARAARLYMTAEAEAGHLVSPIMTNASVAALAHAPDIAGEWLPRIRSRQYDSSARPMQEKKGVGIGVALTEKQGGSDLLATTSRAEDVGDGTWRISGHKWFLSAPMSDAFVTLARTREGVSCFLVPRALPGGARNRIRLMRLKDKLGNRSSATAEAEIDGATGLLIGELGRGLAAIQDMQTLIRLDCTVVSAGLIRIALAEAVHHARYREAFGEVLLEQPLMNRVIADMALDAVAAAALAFRLAESYDRAANDPAEAAFARLMTPAAKYWVAKIAPALIAEAMECLGGNGYVEESKLPRVYREAPFHAVWEGPGNLMCLEVMGVMRKSSEPLEAVLANIEDALGGTAKSTLNVLRAAAAVALADEGSARILTEQLAMTVAAASLRRRFPAVIADAFLETRLGKPWRTTYGMLDSRFDATAFINYICPPV